MNKLVLSLLSVVGLLMVSTPAPADTPAAPPTPAATAGPVDYFKAGQFDEFSNYTSWLKIYSADDLKAKFDSGRAMFVTAGATDKVLASFDGMSKIVNALPMTTSYNSWTQAQKDSWNASGLDGNALNDWLGPVDKAPSFFFWLGFESMRLGKAVPSELNDWGNTLASAQSTAKPALQEFTVLRDQYPSITKTLVPEVSAAITAVAKYNEKALDPMGNGLSKDDFTAIQQQVSVILDAASNGKLTQ